MTTLAEWLALSATGLFSGAALYITAVEHPARMQCGTAVAAKQWAPSYKRATVMQASLAVIGSLSSAAAWLGGAGSAWAGATVLLFAVVPFTLLVIRPTNERLLEPGLDKASAEAATLLARWASLHGVRVLLGLAAFLVLVTATVAGR
jgi:hypothetical protein